MPRGGFDCNCVFILWREMTIMFVNYVAILVIFIVVRDWVLVLGREDE